MYWPGDVFGLFCNVLPNTSILKTLMYIDVLLYFCSCEHPNAETASWLNTSWILSFVRLTVWMNVFLNASVAFFAVSVLSWLKFALLISLFNSSILSLYILTLPVLLSFFAFANNVSFWATSFFNFCTSTVSVSEFAPASSPLDADILNVSINCDNWFLAASLNCFGLSFAFWV